MNAEIAELFDARAWLLSLHAKAEGARSPKLLRRVRVALAAVDAQIAFLTPPPPVRVARKLRDDFAATQYQETTYLGRSVRGDTVAATLVGGL